TVQLRATAPGYTAGTATVTLVPSGFFINSNDIPTTTLSPDTALSVCVAQLDQIGRASCRERAQSAVVAVTMMTQANTTLAGGTKSITLSVGGGVSSTSFRD